ncbi:phytanoyl-CoA dioxygenase family protein [Pseudoalteromonas luteoviolacea]|uniref:phytanoyl-CoA dioxygenase family protein n=1 Tax=Pseudoalteromonas luteoviolacea TaxID=43657 RepID=UPI001B392C8C|nr:phytanoyl-CoA dioxygenase family protein [Pseudoalteromonas luteoviolacea]MBQ4836001.1 phytanoyl-CoA dioxygenase family protein [Pseudoalteromonas luteoviolacea]
MNLEVLNVKDSGFSKLGPVFSETEINQISKAVSEYSKKFSEGIVFEKGTDTIRAIHGPHLYDSFFRDIAQDKRLVSFAQKVLGEQVYVHQFKINQKLAFEGANWPWHQDFIYWQEFDHIEQPNMVNIAIPLDEVNMLNGPLCIVLGSHKLGNVSESVSDNSRNVWQENVSSNLTFQVKKSFMQDVLSDGEYEFVTCAAGEGFAFDPQVIHASSNNMSASDRRIMIITYNAVSNVPKKLSSRPDFLSARSFEPIDV